MLNKNHNITKIPTQDAYSFSILGDNLTNKKLYLCKTTLLVRYFSRLTLFWSDKLLIKIIGKVFRWFFLKKKIKLSVNRSHINIFFFEKNTKIIKLMLGKYNSKLIFLDPIDIVRFCVFLKKTRLSNIFTKRGVFINNVYNKKIGKISSYV